MTRPMPDLIVALWHVLEGLLLLTAIVCIAAFLAGCLIGVARTIGGR